MDATKLLESQHRMVEDLFEEIENANGEEKLKLFEEIADALAAHATIEEEIFYPSCVAAQTEEMLLEATEEHLSAKRVIADIMKMKADDRSFDAKVKVLKDLIEHHVEEEEGELFPSVRRMFSRAELETIGAMMEQRFAELTLSGDAPRRSVPAETKEAAPLPPA